MKIAVTCENHQIFQHFGNTPEFALFESDNGKIVSERIISAENSGHGALAALLANEKVDVLICGNIGGGAINALKLAFILVVGGAEGDVREAAENFLNNTLKVRENFRCSHHHNGENGNCTDHDCADHECSGCHH